MEPNITDSSGFVYQSKGWEKVREMLSSFRYFFGGIFVVVLIGGLALSLTLSQHQQNIQQHASSGTALEGQGIYDSCGPTCFDHLDMFSHVGLTFVMDYSMWGRSTTPEQVQAYAERAAADHIKIIWSLKDMWTDKWTTFSGYTNLIAHCNCHDKIGLARYIVGLVKDYPATWGYYVADEPHSGDYTAVANLSNAIHQTDPNHPRLIVKDDALSNGNAGNVPGGILQYSSLAEVFAEDYYPVSYRQNINSTGAIAGALQTTVNSKGRQSAMVLELNSGNSSDYCHASAYPSTTQMEEMLTLTLQHSQPRMVLWYWYPCTSTTQWNNLVTAIRTVTGPTPTSGPTATPAPTKVPPTPMPTPVCAGGRSGGGGDKYDDSNGPYITCITLSSCTTTNCNATISWNEKTRTTANEYKMVIAPVRPGKSGSYELLTFKNTTSTTLTGFENGIRYTLKVSAWPNDVFRFGYGTPYYAFTAAPPSTPTPTKAPTPTDGPTPTPSGSPSNTPTPTEETMNPDINRDGFVNITDYQILMMCYGDKFNTSYCPASTHPDINGDGVVDGIDYNILLRAMVGE